MRVRLNSGCYKATVPFLPRVINPIINCTVYIFAVDCCNKMRKKLERGLGDNVTFSRATLPKCCYAHAVLSVCVCVCVCARACARARVCVCVCVHTGVV